MWTRRRSPERALLQAQGPGRGPPRRHGQGGQDGACGGATADRKRLDAVHRRSQDDLQHKALQAGARPPRRKIAAEGRRPAFRAGRETDRRWRNPGRLTIHCSGADLASSAPGVMVRSRMLLDDAEASMDRRTFLQATAGAGLIVSGKLAAPALAQGAAARTLRFVPHAALANFDPIWGTANIVRNAGALVWDTLYGFDVELQPQRQMIEAEEVSDDGLTWTFRLRAGLKFHDGEPVRARDVVASLARWSARDAAGRLIRAIQN